VNKLGILDEADLEGTQKLFVNC